MGVDVKPLTSETAWGGAPGQSAGRGGGSRVLEQEAAVPRLSYYASAPPPVTQIIISTRQLEACSLKWITILC